MRCSIPWTLLCGWMRRRRGRGTVAGSEAYCRSWCRSPRPARPAAAAWPAARRRPRQRRQASSSRSRGSREKRRGEARQMTASGTGSICGACGAPGLGLAACLHVATRACAGFLLSAPVHSAAVQSPAPCLALRTLLQAPAAAGRAPAGAGATRARPAAQQRHRPPPAGAAERS